MLATRNAPSCGGVGSRRSCPGWSRAGWPCVSGRRGGCSAAAAAPIQAMGAPAAVQAGGAVVAGPSRGVEDRDEEELTLSTSESDGESSRRLQRRRPERLDERDAGEEERLPEELLPRPRSRERRRPAPSRRTFSGSIATATEPFLKATTSNAQPVIAKLLRLELGSQTCIITGAKLKYLGHRLLGCTALPESFVEVDDISNHG